MQNSWRQPLWEATMEPGLVLGRRWYWEIVSYGRYELFLTQIFSFCTLCKISCLVYSLSASPLYTVCVWIISVIYTHTCMSTASKAKLCKSFFLFCLFWTILFDYIYQIDLVSNRIIGLFCSRPSLYRNLQFDQQNCLDQWLLGMAVVPYSDGLVKYQEVLVFYIQSLSSLISMYRFCK